MFRCHPTIRPLICFGLLLGALMTVGCSSSPAMRPNVAQNDRALVDGAAPSHSSCAGDLCFVYADAQ